MRRFVNLLTVMLATVILSGCAARWGQVDYIPPAATETNIAKVRLVGNPAGFTIGQFGKKAGNVDNSKIVIFKSTTDKGLPKLPNVPERYKETYFETTLYAGTPTEIAYSLAGCNISISFMPEKNEVYEFRVDFSKLAGYCILYGVHVKYDKENDIYVEGPILRVKSDRYKK